MQIMEKSAKGKHRLLCWLNGHNNDGYWFITKIKYNKTLLTIINKCKQRRQILVDQCTLVWCVTAITRLYFPPKKSAEDLKRYTEPKHDKDN